MKAKPTAPSTVSQSPNFSDPASQTTPPTQPPTGVAQRPDAPRIYVASLADYNAGRLVGRWIDADQDADAIHKEIAAMLTESHEPIAEEWAIHDYEYFGSLRISEYEDIALVADAAALIGEHGGMIAELLNHFGGLSGIEEAKRYMEEGYRGAFDSLADYAQESIEDCFGDAIAMLPDFIRYHIDYEGIARDFEYAGEIFTIECDRKIHVFDSCL